MPEFTKSQKIRISIISIWAIITALLSGAVAQDYGDFNFSTFIAAFIILNLPTILYGFGYWIWGDGYLKNIVIWPFKKTWPFFSHLKLSPNSKKIFAFIVSIFAFIVLFFLSSAIAQIPSSMSPNSPPRSISSIESAISLIGLVVSCLASIRVYRFLAKEPQQADSLISSPLPRSRNELIIIGTVSVVAFGLSLAAILITAEEQQTNSAYLFGETLGAFILLGALTLFFTPKKWKNSYQTPILTIAFLFASIFICYPKYKEAKDATLAVHSIATAIEGEYLDAATAKDVNDLKLSKIEVPESNQLSPLVKYINETRERGAAIIIDYTNSLPLDFEKTLAPETLSDIHLIRAYKTKLSVVLGSIPTYRMRSKQHIERMEKDVQNLDIDPAMKASTLKGIKTSQEGGLQQYMDYFDIQEGTLTTVVELLDMMDNAYGSYQFNADGQPIFNSDEDVQQYNNLIASINSWALQEQSWKDAAQSKELEMAKKLKETAR